MLTLHRLSLAYRVLYTGVAVLACLGALAHLAHQGLRGGVSPHALAAWYRGNADDPIATSMLFEKSFEEVLADVWLTLTTYTMTLLVLGSLAYRSSAPRPFKSAVLVTFIAAALSASAAPLLIRYASAGFAFLLSAALIVLPLCVLALTVEIVDDMWRRGRHGVRLDPRPV